jgi:UDP-3-O-[3-hydroxymyristoyl] glucosamine N-acyltransferase
MRPFGPQTARNICALVNGGVLQGDAEHILTNAAPLAGADEQSVCFLRGGNPAAIEKRAGLIIVSPELAIESIPGEVRPHALFKHPFPESAWATMLSVLFPQVPVAEGISQTAVIAKDAFIGQDVAIGPNAVIGPGARIGARTQIGPGCTIGQAAAIGEQCVVHAGVHIYPGVRIGNRCIIHSGTVIGADGFGYTANGKGIVKVPQIGGVVIGNDVEIGANCTIDRAAVDDTVIEDFVKLDNLVHVAHNCRIGAGTMIAAQAGIAGSTIIGKGVQIGGQAGLAGHLTVGDGSRISAQAGVISDVSPKSEVTGFPARPRGEFMRMMAWLTRAARGGKKTPKA